MFATFPALKQTEQRLSGILRTVLKMLTEQAARESRMRREMVTMRAQLDELHVRLAAIEDAPALTDEIEAGEAISEAVRG